MAYALLHLRDEEASDGWRPARGWLKTEKSGITTTTTLALDLTTNPMATFSIHAVGAAGFTSATVKLETSYDGTSWATLDSQSVTGTTPVVLRGEVTPALHVRASVTAIDAGTGSLSLGLIATP